MEEGGAFGVVGASRGIVGVTGEDSTEKCSPVKPRNMSLEFERGRGVNFLLFLKQEGGVGGSKLRDRIRWQCFSRVCEQ